MRNVLVGAAVCAIAILISCQEAQFPSDSLPQGNINTTIGDTVYIEQYPVWTGFNHPQAVIVGNEPFIYIADTDNDRVVMLDLIGRVIGYSKPIKHPVALAEDKRLQLLVCAQFDTLLPGKSTPTTFGAVYRLDLVSTGHAINSIVPRRVFFEPGDSTRRYTGIATLFNNFYYLCRTGPKNSPQSFDWDNSVIAFTGNDQLLTSVTQSLFTPDGTGLLSINSPSAIATRPGITSVEFVYCQTATKVLFKVQWILLVSAGQTTNFISKYDANTVDLLRINRFTQPAGVTIDPSGNLFVVDAARDSLYRFSASGFERYSFGGTGSGERQFREPSGVAFFDKTLFVADRGNNRIVRFKLSSDIR